jgi:hypothetical protein
MRRLAGLWMVLPLLCLQPSRSWASLIGYWSFDGCSSTDASGHVADLTSQGAPICTAGRFGDAWLLNGTGQWLDRGADSNFTPGSRSWSVAAWVRTGAAPNFCVVLEWYRCGANPLCGNQDGAYYILSLGDGHATWDVRDDTANDFTLSDTFQNLADGQWHFLVGTLASDSDSMKLFVDGALRKSAVGPSGNLSSGGVAIPLEVGRHFRTGWGVPDFYFPGAIDEVRIYDNALSAAAVTALYLHNSTTDVPRVEPRGLSIEAGSPNPTRGDRMRIAFTLPSAEPAVLALFDLGGRRVARSPLGSLGAGRHEVDLAAGHRLPPGVYLVQLTQGGLARTRHITVLE